MFLASDVVCVKDQPNVLGIVEAVGNEDEAEAQNLDPAEVGLEVFWPGRPPTACTTVETARTLDLVDRAFLSGDVVIRRHQTLATPADSTTPAAPLVVGSVQRLNCLLDLRLVPATREKGARSPAPAPMLHRVNAQHLQHLQRFKRGFPCVVQHDSSRRGTHPSLYQVMDWHVDILVGFEDGCVCLVVDAYAEDILTDAELDCINEESPFYPGQVLRSKGKRSSFFKDKPYLQGRWKRTHKEGTILFVVPSAVDLLPVTHAGALDAQRALALLPADAAQQWGAAEFSLMAGPLPPSTTEDDVRAQWPAATALTLREHGDHRYALLEFASQEALHQAVGQHHPGAATAAAAAFCPTHSPAGSEPGQDTPPQPSKEEDDDGDRMDESLSPASPGRDEGPADDDDNASVDSGPTDAPKGETRKSNAAKAAKAGAKGGASTTPGGAPSPMSLRVHPAEVHALDFFWYTGLSLGDFVTPIRPDFVTLQDKSGHLGNDPAGRRILPEQLCPLSAPPLKTDVVTDTYNWHQKERIKWYRNALKTGDKSNIPPVYEICGRRTTCTVMWQDGVLEEDVPSVELVPRAAQRFDFIPKDFVTASTLGAAPGGPTRVGVVQRVNATERTCAIRWLDGDGTLDVGVSCYDVELLNVRPQDIVLRVPRPHGPTPPPASPVGGAMQVDGPSAAPTDASPPALVSDSGSPPIHPPAHDPDGGGGSDPSLEHSDATAPVPAESSPSPPVAGPSGVGGALWTFLQRIGGLASRALAMGLSGGETPGCLPPAEAPVYLPVRCGQILQFLDDGLLEVVWHDGGQDVVPYGDVVVVRPEWIDNAGGQDGGEKTDAGSEKSWETLSDDAEEGATEGHPEATPQEGAPAGPAADGETAAPAAAAGGEEEPREPTPAPPEAEPVTNGVGQGGYSEGDEDGLDMIESGFQVMDKFEAHAYAADPLVGNPGRALPKRVRQEWKTLATSLPKFGIAVRATSENLQLLKALISGPRFTPYYRGLYAFDVMLPNDYPSSPPKVKFHAYNMRINPNLYDDGYVCLSLLGTWTGHKECERWSESSNLLQVLLSIQSLVLCAEPYYNEPGYDRQLGSPEGETSSRSYNEQVMRLKLAHLVEMTRNPSADFTEEVNQHIHTVLPKMYEVVQKFCQTDAWRPVMSPQHKCDAEGLLGPATGGLVASLRKTVMPALDRVLHPNPPTEAATSAP